MFVKVLSHQLSRRRGTYSEIVRLVEWKDYHNLVLLPESRDELRDVPASPKYQLRADFVCIKVYLRLSRISSSFSIRVGLLVAKIRFMASLTS